MPNWIVIRSNVARCAAQWCLPRRLNRSHQILTFLEHVKTSQLFRQNSARSETCEVSWWDCLPRKYQGVWRRGRHQDAEEGQCRHRHQQDHDVGNDGDTSGRNTCRGYISNDWDLIHNETNKVLYDSSSCWISKHFFVFRISKFIKVNFTKLLVNLNLNINLLYLCIIYAK